MLTVLIPAAGSGTRFRQAGYQVSKPLIPVAGIPMIKRVMTNVAPTKPHRFVIISRMDDADIAPLLGPLDTAIHLQHPTEGAIDTILAAGHLVNYEPLIVANCDQLALADIDAFIKYAHGTDGALMTFRSANEHHSYVKTNEDGIITEIAEKVVISSQAVTGIYYFSHGIDFIAHCEQVIADNERVANGEFYVSSAISRMIANGRRFVTYDAPCGILGTPAELQMFEMAVEVGREL